MTGTGNFVQAPLIVTALFGAADFAWLDRLRRTHYPPERNVVPAHLTLFHHLTPSLGEELRGRLAAEARAHVPLMGALPGLMRLDGGFAFRVACQPLEEIRARLADAFHGLLTPQDAAPWHPHVTIQNKAPRTDADTLYQVMSERFVPRDVAIAGLASWCYLGGPWEPLSRHMFSRSARGLRN